MHPDDTRLPPTLVFRDLAVALGSLALWQWSHRLQDAGASGATITSVAAGVLLTVAAYFAHEWGHLGGALLARSRVHYPRGAWTLFLFRFDVDRNGRREFLAMSLGGYLASILVVALFLAGLSWHYLADAIALSLTALGVLATFILELPPFWRVWHGAPLPHGAAFVSARD